MKDEKLRKRDLINIFVLVLIISIGFYRLKNKTYTFNKDTIMLDTVVKSKIVIPNKNGAAILDSAFAMMDQYEKVFSYYTENSTLDKINKSETETIEISDEFYNILSYCKQIYNKSDSLYDVSIGELTDIWNFDNKIVPSHESIENAINNSGFDKVIINKTNIIKPNNIKINLGSIAKGYIVDKGIDYLISKGAKSGFINAGGDIRFFGNSNQNKTVGIQHPRDRNDIIGKVTLTNQAIVTSGDYERFFEVEGKRYHHIIDPKTGYPAENTISVTIIASTAMEADALSTACFVMPPEKAIELIKNTPDTEIIIYYRKDDSIISMKSQGIKKYLVKEYLN